MKGRVTVMAVSVVVSACGPTTFVDFCKQSAARSCKRLFQCQGSAATSLYANEAACAEDLGAKAKCDAFADLPCDLDSARANACLSGIDATSCEALSMGDTPASCRDPGVCPPRAGTVTCRENSSSTTNAGCSYSRASCSDGKAYAIACMGSACSCSTDGAAGVTFEDAGFCRKSSQDKASLLRSICKVEVF